MPKSAWLLSLLLLSWERSVNRRRGRAVGTANRHHAIEDCQSSCVTRLQQEQGTSEASQHLARSEAAKRMSSLGLRGFTGQVDALPRAHTENLGGSLGPEHGPDYRTTGHGEFHSPHVKGTCPPARGTHAVQSPAWARSDHGCSSQRCCDLSRRRQH
jgi:hypothetical protein